MRYLEKIDNSRFGKVVGWIFTICLLAILVISIAGGILGGGAGRAIDRGGMYMNDIYETYGF